jgi:hypothetical protein
MMRHDGEKMQDERAERCRMKDEMALDFEFRILFLLIKSALKTQNPKLKIFQLSSFIIPPF